MISFVYFALFALSIFNIIVLSVIVKQQRSFYYVLFFMLISVFCFGHITIIHADNLAVALVGNTLTYMGSCFIPYIFLLCLSELCLRPIKKWASLLMFAYNSAVFILVWMTQANVFLYYSKVELVEKSGVKDLLTYAGSHRFLYEISVAFYSLAAIWNIIAAFRNKYNISYKNLLIIISLELVTIVMYSIQKQTNLVIDVVCISFIIDELIMLVLIYRIGKYDVSESIAGSIDGQEDYAYMVFDMKLNYLGSSSMLKKLFPTVSHVRVDHPIVANGNPTIEKAVTWLTLSVASGNKEPLYVKASGRDLKCTWRPINNGLFGKQSGYLVELFDDTNQRKYINLISNYSARLEEEVAAKVEHIQKLQDQMIIGISDIVESRDNSTGGHVKRTSEAVRIFMEELGKENEVLHMTAQYAKNVIKAAPMHDLGKIAVDDYILKKPGRYTKEEYCQMQVHAAVGAKIVGKALYGIEDEAFMDVAQNIAHYHHEKWDGSGYPEGLSGEAIPLEARIMALADVFDALVSKRCYKEKYCYDEAFQIIEDALGSHFDPRLGKIFLNCRTKLEEYYNTVG